MKINYYKNRVGHRSQTWIFAAILLILAGCRQTPDSGPAEAAGNSGEAITGSDQNRSDYGPVAESRPQTTPPPNAESNQPVVGVSAYWNAALDGKIETVRQAIESGVAVDAADDQRRTALMLAAFNGHTPVAKLLLDKGAEVDHRDAAGRTALMFAATGANAETVELLLDAGAKINAVDSGEGFTALMHAAAEGQVRVVEVLLQRKADRAMRDEDGDTAEDFASRNGHAEVVRLLKK